MKFDLEFCKRFGIDSAGRPSGRLRWITRNDGVRFYIKPLDAISERYNERLDNLAPTCWAVFRSEPNSNFDYQVTKWYLRYGYAVRMLGELAKDVEN